MPDTIRLALWGPSGAGKTAYLAQLYFRQFVQDEWKVLPGFAPDEDPESPAEYVFIKAANTKLLANNFPAPTAAGAGGNSVRYLFQHKTDGREGTLYANDRAGADWLQLDQESMAELRQADGVILLFDTKSLGPQLESDVRRALEELRRVTRRETATDSRPFAICLSKADTLIQEPLDLELAERSPLEFVRKKITKELEGWVRNHCDTFELFPVSSVGVKVRYGVVEPLWFLDETREARIGTRAEPINVMKPFDWIFRKIAARKAVPGEQA